MDDERSVIKAKLTAMDIIRRDGMTFYIFNLFFSFFYVTYLRGEVFIVYIFVLAKYIQIN